jgi:phosphate:Na+ symporter
MTGNLMQMIGGVGLFLIGMTLLTDGLKAFAGEALRRALVRFTGTPLKAFGSGALVTMAVQSSSATTVAVIGFVSAGLLTFPQAVGVVLGASLGTTGTGWVVAWLGLKVSVGLYALPFVGAGAFLRLLGRHRWKSMGMALAGFGLIFIGIGTLQEAMQGLAGVFNLASLPSSGISGHLLALLAGLVLTVLMQSSSAAVATVLTAMHTGTVSFEQAASLVIGAAMGTTVTGALAAIGGTVSAKRTALAHVLFNLGTGGVALVLLPVFLGVIGWAQARLGLDAGATSLAAFHTLFIGVGVGLLMPWVNGFSRMIERVLPEEEGVLARHLDRSLLQVPEVALEASRRALVETACEVFGRFGNSLGGAGGEGLDEAGRRRTLEALDEVQRFFAQIPQGAGNGPGAEMRVAQMHAMDHLGRLEAHGMVPMAVQRGLIHPRVEPALMCARELLGLAKTGLRGETGAEWVGGVEQRSAALVELRRQERPAVFRQTAVGDWQPGAALEVLEALRWLDRVGYHTWRVAHYLADGVVAKGTPAESDPVRKE